MAKYVWGDVDQLEDAIASSRLSAEIIGALPEVAPFALSARKDAILAELIAAVLGSGGGGALTKRVEWFTRVNGQNNADNIIIVEMTGYTRQGGLGDTVIRWRSELIKMVPPTPEQGGRWGAYLNGVLKKTFTGQANFPRGSQATDRNYRLIQPGFWAWPDASQIPGILLHDLRIVVEDDWSL